MKPTILLEAGHGGYDFEKRINYTNPKNGKFFIHPDGTAIYEGEFNRAIVARLIPMLQAQGLKVINIVPEIQDINLNERVKRINALFAQDKSCIHYSIHANAFETKEGKPQAHGAQVNVHTQPSERSMQMAKAIEKAALESPIFHNNKAQELERLKWRFIEPKNLQMCRETHTPSVLIENPFMTNYQETKLWLLSEQGRDKLANWIFQGIMNYVNGLV